MNIKNNAIFYINGKWEFTHNLLDFIKKYIGTTEETNISYFKNDKYGFVVNTGYCGTYDELINDRTFIKMLRKSNNCKVEVVFNDFDTLSQTLVICDPMIKKMIVNDGNCNTISFDSLIRTYEESEKDCFMEEISRLFNLTNYIVWDMFYFDDLFELYKDNPKDMKESIFEYICDKRLLFSTKNVD